MLQGACHALQAQLEAALEHLEANTEGALSDRGQAAAEAYAAACAAGSTEDGADLLAGFRCCSSPMDTDAAAEASLAIKGLKCASLLQCPIL